MRGPRRPRDLTPYARAVTRPTDQQLLKALIHDALALCDSAEEKDLAIVKEELLIAKALLDETGTDVERTRVEEIVHASTRSHFLTG